MLGLTDSAIVTITLTVKRSQIDGRSDSIVQLGSTDKIKPNSSRHAQSPPIIDQATNDEVALSQLDIATESTPSDEAAERQQNELEQLARKPTRIGKEVDPCPAQSA